jgi:hypothetical protein
MRTQLTGGLIAATLAAAATVATGQGYNDGTGREWRQVNATTGMSWSQVASVCPTDGSGPCSGIASGRDLTGWYWASQAEVQEFFALFAPEIGDMGCVGGPAYVLSGLFMLDGGVINPTWSYYTTFGGYLYVSGWTSTRGTEGNAILGAASAQYPVFDGALCVTGQAAVNTIPQFNGVWLWRPVPCAAPTVTAEPTDAVTCGRNDVVQFTIEADATGTAGYQWRRNGMPISGQDNPTALTPALVLAGALQPGTFDCVVTDRCGSVTSAPAVLVVCPADFDCSGGVDGDDVIGFFAAWDNGEIAADFTGDSGVDGDDVIGFFARWDVGC